MAELALEDLADDCLEGTSERFFESSSFSSLPFVTAEAWTSFCALSSSSELCLSASLFFVFGDAALDDTADVFLESAILDLGDTVLVEWLDFADPALDDPGLDD